MFVTGDLCQVAHTGLGEWWVCILKHRLCGFLLTCFRWHRVVISHRGQEVDVTLDSGTQRMQAREGHQHLHMDPAVFFGGMETSHIGLGE